MPRRDDDRDDDFDLRRRRKRARQEKQNRTLYILLAAGAVVVMGCGGVAVFVASAVKQAARAARDINRVANPGTEAGPPTIQVSAEDLYKAYEKNEDRADDKHGGESVQVDGVVEMIDNQPVPGWRVTLSTGRNHARVHASFDSAREAAVSRLTPGQRCSIIGTCDGRVAEFEAFGGRPPRDFEAWVVGLSGCRLAE